MKESGNEACAAAQGQRQEVWGVGGAVCRCTLNPKTPSAYPKYQGAYANKVVHMGRLHMPPKLEDADTKGPDPRVAENYKGWPFLVSRGLWGNLHPKKRE